jgi:hypothetical protein
MEPGHTLRTRTFRRTEAERGDLDTPSTHHRQPLLRQPQQQLRDDAAQLPSSTLLFSHDRPRLRNMERDAADIAERSTSHRDYTTERQTREKPNESQSDDDVEPKCARVSHDGLCECDRSILLFRHAQQSLSVDAVLTQKFTLLSVFEVSEEFHHFIRTPTTNAKAEIRIDDAR